ncbi:MAG: S8 family serine peptidase [Thermoanaerobaculia bacterium]|nr:S8 family serine peptidase [Thermoanaerobaculia bacterium]
MVAIVLTGIGLTTQAAQGESNRPIALRSVAVDTSSATTGSSGPDPTVRLLQFEAPISADQRKILDASVEEVYTYLPPNAYLVRICSDDGCAADSLRQARWLKAGVSWSGPFLSEYKISPEIARTVPDSQALRPVLLHLFPDRDLGTTSRELEAILEKTPVASVKGTRFNRLRFLLTDAEIVATRQALAEVDAVYWIEREARRVLLNDTTIWVGQSGLDGGQSTPAFDHGLHGEGQIVAVLDTGIDADACYFWDGAEGIPPTNCGGLTAVDLDQRKVIAADFLWSNDCNGGINANEWDSQGHGSHVAGTVAGDDPSSLGIHNGRDGMAPAARLVIQDGGYATDNCADLPGLGCAVGDLQPIFLQAYTQGARIHTNSWGDEEEDPTYGEYTAGSEDADQFMWDHPDFLLLFAAGNNGGPTATVDSPSTAKSPISVGSTLRGAAADSISSFSSRGPTEDGRIKPDLTNPGSSIQSSGNDFSVTDPGGSPSCASASNSGTSMATPGVAGFAALTRQYYMDGYYPSGSPTPGDAFAPSAALVKTTLIHSGTQMSNEGTIPNDTQGWGRVLLDSALHFAGDQRKLWVEDDPVGFANGSGGSSISYMLVVEDGSEPLEITLGWTDYPSTPAASTHLVNDLDLVVSGPDGTFRGNVFSGGFSTVGGSPDRLNTTENIFIDSPTPGAWTVTVEAFAVPSGTSQPFALVASGRMTSCTGPGSAIAAAGSEILTPSGGDLDPYLDNCEGGHLEFSVLNQGATSASNLSILSVTSPSHPGTVFAPPTWTAASLGACTVSTGAYVDILSAAGLQSGDTLLVDVEMTNDEIAPATTVATFQVQNTELDLAFAPTLEYDFESDLQGWSVTNGTFVRDTALGGASGSAAYLQSSENLGDQCDSIQSPEIFLTASSVLSLATHYDIEPNGTSGWYDRANLSILDQGALSVAEPSSGRLYDIESGTGNGPCGTDGEGGWAGSQESWDTSSFDATALDSANRAGRPVRLQVDYATDGGLHLGGFRFDQVTLTDVSVQGPDAQSNQCDLGAIFIDGFETGDSSRWSSATP